MGPRITRREKNWSNVMKRGMCFYMTVEKLIAKVISTWKVEVNDSVYVDTCTHAKKWKSNIVSHKKSFV